jgi:hypothetical protein
VREPLDQGQRARIGQLLDAVAVGQAEDEDRDALETTQLLLDRPDRDADLAVVRSACQLDELELRGPRQEEMGIHGDAVTADAEARLVDVRVRLAIRRVDHLVDVDPDPFGVASELVGEGDVDIPIGRVGELAELGRLCALHRDDLGVEDGVVERRGPSRGARPDPADELRIGREVAQGGAAVQALRRECDEEVLVRTEAGLAGQARREPLPRVADRERRLEDHERAGMDTGGDRGDG